MQSESLYHSLVSGHANPCLLADELRAGAGGSGPRLTLPVPLTIASPSGCLAPVCRQLSLGLSGQVCVPPPCLSCRGGRGGGSVPHQHLRKLLFPVQPSSLLPHPHPKVPLPTASLQRDTQPGGRHLPHRRHCRLPVCLGPRHLPGRGWKESRRPQLFWLPWRSPQPCPGSRVGHRLQWKRNVVDSC